MERASCTSGDEGQIDVGLGGGGKLHLCLFGCFLQTLQSHLVGTKIDSIFSLEFIGYPVDYALIPVVAAQVVVTSGRANLKITPSPSSRTETSNVPPPRSKTKTFSSLLVLSRP